MDNSLKQLQEKMTSESDFANEVATLASGEQLRAYAAGRGLDLSQIDIAILNDFVAKLRIKGAALSEAELEKISAGGEGSYFQWIGEGMEGA